jgi:hypothetical protein
MAQRAFAGCRLKTFDRCTVHNASKPLLKLGSFSSKELLVEPNFKGGTPQSAFSGCCEPFH